MLQLHTSYSDRFVDIVGEGFDCAIRVGNLSDSNMMARHIGAIEAKLVASPDYIQKYGAPNTPDEVLSHEALMQGTESWQFIDGDKTITIRPNGRFKADNGAALAAAAAAGLGLAWLPDCLIEEYLASGALVPVMANYPVPSGGVYVLRPPGQHPARKVRVLTELLIEHFG
jgi:DNA-binding transcriptional LysR family regulator